MAPAFKEPPTGEPSQESKPEPKKEPKQPAPHPEAIKSATEPSAPLKPSVSSKAEISKPKVEVSKSQSEPPRKVEHKEHKEHKEKVMPPVPERPAQERKESPGVGGHGRLEQLERFIVTNTPQIEGRQILAYHGIASATVFVRGDLVKERLDGMTGEVISIHSSPLEGLFEKARVVALTDLKVDAAKRGANAVVGLTLSQTPGIGGIWLCLIGTAVTLKE
jgi:uncharacterized protein YbjQ (UPF0145 family)